MSNEVSFNLTIKTSSPERREQVFREVIDLQLENKYYYEYLTYSREEENGISIHAKVRGYPYGCKELLSFHTIHPDVSEDFYVFDYINGFDGHRIFNPDTWEELMTEEDCISSTNWEWGRSGSFYPEDLVMHTYRKVYDWNDNLILEESKDVPFPEERMYDHNIRVQYEQWKKDPEGWEREKEREMENEKYASVFSPTVCTCGDDEEDELPFL